MKILPHGNFLVLAVDQLSSVAVKNYKEIEDRIAEGTKNRTIASTNMNATSSRAHTIVAVTFVQKCKKSGQSMAKTSAINLVDLAGRYAGALEVLHCLLLGRTTATLESKLYCACDLCHLHMLLFLF